MKKVVSISGGKSSAYIFANYPSDYAIFSLVTTNDVKCIYPDKKIRQMVSDKIGKEFIGTLEQNTIIEFLFSLEQLVGKEITFVSGQPFENVIKLKGGYLPNVMTRFCTTEMKIKPIFKWWKENINEVVEMQIGFRANETKRANKMMLKLNNKGIEEMKTIIGKRKTLNKWGMVEWRIPKFPLIDNLIFKDNIELFWKNKNVKFEKNYINNCVGCFHRSPLFLKKMSQEHPNKFEWFIDQEKINSPNKFKKQMSYQEIKNLNIQKELDFDSDFNDCDTGYCGL